MLYLFHSRRRNCVFWRKVTITKLFWFSNICNLHQHLYIWEVSRKCRVWFFLGVIKKYRHIYYEVSFFALSSKLKINKKKKPVRIKNYRAAFLTMKASLLLVFIFVFFVFVFGLFVLICFKLENLSVCVSQFCFLKKYFSRNKKDSNDIIKNMFHMKCRNIKSAHTRQENITLL